MSERAITSFKEYDTSATSEYLRIRRLITPLRAAYAQMDVLDRYALLSGPVFGRVLKSKHYKAPEYPTQRKGEHDLDFRARRENFKAANALYRQQIEEYCDQMVEAIVQRIERLNTEGEYYDEKQKKTSSLQRAEGWHERCSIPVFSALLLGLPWKALEPQPKPLPKGTQTSLF